MKYNGSIPKPGSWTRHIFVLSYANIESIRILINSALDRKDMSYDEHTIGFAQEFSKVYHEILLSKAGDEISKQVANDIKARLDDSIKNANSYIMD